jgi:hypothetical protein
MMKYTMDGVANTFQMKERNSDIVFYKLSDFDLMTHDPVVIKSPVRYDRTTISL